MARAARQSDILFPNIQADLLVAIQALDIEQPNIPKLYDRFNTIIKNLNDVNLPKEDNELERSLQELDCERTDGEKR